MQLFTGDYVAQDVSVGFARFLPAQLQCLWAQGSEDQGARGTGGTQGKWRTCKTEAERGEEGWREKLGGMDRCDATDRKDAGPLHVYKECLPF